MYKFENTWPFDVIMGDVYFHTCPYCGEEDILLPLSKADFKKGKEEVKVHAIMPCCHSKMTILKIDDDYFWSDEILRRGTK